MKSNTLLRHTILAVFLLSLAYWSTAQNTGIMPWFNEGNNYGNIEDSTFHRHTITAYKLDDGDVIAVDGIRESVWDKYPVININRTFPDVGLGATSVPSPEDLSATAKIAYDDNYLYMFVEVHDDVIVERLESPTSYSIEQRFEIVCVYWGTDFPYNADRIGTDAGGFGHWAWNIEDGDRRYEFWAGNDSIYDWRTDFAQVANQTTGAYPSNIDFVYTNTGSSYIYEIKFPWVDALSVTDPVEPGDAFSFDISVEDGENDVDGREYMLAANSAWNNLYAWQFFSGKMVLGNKYPSQYNTGILSWFNSGNDFMGVLPDTAYPRNDISAYRLPYGQTVVIDGAIDPVWDSHPETPIGKVMLDAEFIPSPAPGDISAWSKIVYDDENLYILVRVEDDNIIEHDHVPTTMNDRYDLFEITWGKHYPYNPDQAGKGDGGFKHWAWNMEDGDRKYDFYAGLDTIYDWRSNYKQIANQTTGVHAANIDFSYSNEDTCYIWEIKLPWSEALAFKDGVSIGELFSFDLAIEDFDLTAAREDKLAINSEWNNLYAWRFYSGRLQLMPEFTQKSISNIVWIEPKNTDGSEEIILTLDPSKACVPEVSLSLVGVPSIGMHSSAVLEDEPDVSWFHIVGYDQAGKDGTLPVLLPNGDGTYSMTFTPSLFYGTGDAKIKGISAVFNDGTGWEKEGKAFGAVGCKDFYILFGSYQTNANALFLDGVDDYVNINKALSPLLSEIMEYTLECWIKPVDNKNSVISINYGEGYGEGNLLLGMGGGYEIGYYDWEKWVGGKDAMGINDWHHIALSVDEYGNGVIYLNGIPQATFTGAHFPLPGGTMSLGMEYDGPLPSDFWKGTIDNVMIWNNARTQEDIENDMKMNITGDEPNLAAMYTFEDINGNILPDNSPNGNNGILYNDPRIVPSYGNMNIAPSQPVSLQIFPTSSGISVKWETKYKVPGQSFRIYLDDPDNLIGTCVAMSYTITNLDPATEYTVYISTYNPINGQESEKTSFTRSTLGLTPVIAAKVNPVIGGQIDSIWNTLSTTNVCDKLIIGTTDSEQDLSAEFRTIWTIDSLYLLVIVKDDNLVHTGTPNTWEDDAIELFLDIGNEKATAYDNNDVHLRFNWNSNIITGAHLDNLVGDGINGIHFAQTVWSDGYIFEIALPWIIFNIADPAVGKLIGLELALDDSDGSNRETMIGWTAITNNAWQDPSIFGTVELVSEDTQLNLQVSSGDSYADIPEGFIRVDVQGGSPPYTYNWSTGDTISTIENLYPGLYSLTVTDSKANTATADIMIQNLGYYYSQCGEGKAEITVKMLTDGQGDETMWMLTVADTTYFYVPYGRYGNNTLYTENICVPVDENITFTIYDFNGDGICCDNGNGYYEVSSSCATLAEGGEFSSFESTTFQVSGHVEQAEFMDIVGGMGAEVLNKAIRTCEGYFVAAGYTDTYGAGKKDFYLIKTDGRGDTLWTKTYGDANNNNAVDLVQTGDGGSLLLGDTKPGSNTHPLIVKTDKNGVQKWTKTYDFANSLSGIRLVSDPDSGYYILADNQDISDHSMIIRMIDSGDTLWTGTYAGDPADLILTDDGGFIILITESESGKGMDVKIRKYDASGSYKWEKIYGGSLDDQAVAIEKTFDGGYIILASKEVSAGQYETWIINTDASGNVSWDQTYGDGEPTGIVQTNTLDYVMTVNHTPGNAELVSADPNGDETWRRTIDFGMTGHYLYSIELATNGGYILAGKVVDPTMIPDAFILHTNSSGTGCYARPYEEEEICLVTIDPDSEKNLVVWEKTNNVGTGYYNIYRETSEAGVYQPIGLVPFSQLSQFIDSTSTPKNKIHRYKIAAVDTCGNESEMSDYHQPLLLTVTVMANDAGFELDWSDYEVEGGELNFKTYMIYGGTDSTNLQVIDSVAAGTQNKYPDFRTVSKKTKYYYRVGGVMYDICTPTGTLKAGTGPYSHSMSNIDDNRLQVSPNMAPTDIALASLTLDEGLPVNTLIGKFSTTDVDTLDKHAYTLVSGTGDDDNASFTITGDSLLSAEIFDYELKDVYSIRVRTTDDGVDTSLSYEEVFAITINDVYEPSANQSPTDIMLDVNTIDENEPAGSLVGRLTTSDADAGDTHTYSLVTETGDDDNSDFTIQRDSLLTASVFDYETKNAYSIRIKTTDSGEGNLSFEKSFSVTVTNVVEVGLDQITEKEIRIYPNPFSETATLVFPNPEGRKYSLKLMDITGKTVRIVTNIVDSSYMLEKQDLEKGLYLLELSGDRIYRGRIIIE